MSTFPNLSVKCHELRSEAYQERPRRRVVILVSRHGMSHTMPEGQYISNSLCIVHAELLVAHPLSC